MHMTVEKASFIAAHDWTRDGPLGLRISISTVRRATGRIRAKGRG